LGSFSWPVTSTVNSARTIDAANPIPIPPVVAAFIDLFMAKSFTAVVGKKA
jgi:hypothetical protein